MWNPASKSPILGKLYCSPNYICFASKVVRNQYATVSTCVKSLLSIAQIADIVWVVAPLRDVAAVEKLNQPETLPNGLLISTKSKNNTIIFANLDDREQTHDTITSFIAHLPTPKP